MKVKDYTQNIALNIMKKAEPLFNKIKITDIPDIIPLKIITEENIYTLKLNMINCDTYELFYEPFRDIPNKYKYPMATKYIFKKPFAAYIIVLICEQMINEKAVEVGSDLQLKGNENIVKIYKVFKDEYNKKLLEKGKSDE